jgi:DNA-binding response OmpR family regulator
MTSMNPNEPHILIVEDDCELAEWMHDYLSLKAYRVIVCHRGDEAVGLSYNTTRIWLSWMACCPMQNSIRYGRSVVAVKLVKNQDTVEPRVE